MTVFLAEVDTVSSHQVVTSLYFFS